MREESKRLSYGDVALLTERDILLQLREYLIAYRVFASGTTSTGFEIGQHNPYEFKVKYGLCFNLHKYTSSVADGFELEMMLDAALSVQFEMWLAENQQTLAVDADFAYPFGEGEYYTRHTDRTQHECPKRLAFINHTIEVLLV